MKPGMHKNLSAAAIAACLLISTSITTQSAGFTENDTTATEPGIKPALLWTAAQLIPSPQWITNSTDGTRFGLRWQVTPILYSFGINKRLNPWRYFIAEPFVRQSGSIELFLSPEYYNLNDVYNSEWLLRGGLRAYFPLWRFGEYLSCSLGSSYYVYNENSGISYEAGIYFLYGIVGIQTTYTPSLPDTPWIFTLRIRYF
jgi:hypothetical protein